jgi:septin family protein
MICITIFFVHPSRDHLKKKDIYEMKVLDKFEC